VARLCIREGASVYGMARFARVFFFGHDAHKLWRRAWVLEIAQIDIKPAEAEFESGVAEGGDVFKRAKG